MNYYQKKKLVVDDYNAIADIYAREDRNIDFYGPYIKKFISSLDGEDVLDACCGAGEFSNFIAENNKNVTGVDFSENLINIAKSRYKNIEFIVEDIVKIEESKKFDGIFSKDALFHLPDEDLNIVIKKFHNILTSNGKLLLILDIPKEPGEKIYVEPLDERLSLYYNYLTVDKIKSLLTANKFIVEDVKIVSKSDYEYAQGVMFIYAKKR